MDQQSDDLIDKIRQQFDAVPYPNISLEQSAKDNLNELFIHNFLTPYYLRNQKVIETEGRVILDVGCGSGYTTLVLAEANPDSTVIGIDLSEESIKLAKQRLQYHEFKNTEFYTISIENLPQLNLQFDYINCNDVLYLLSNLILGLQAIKSVLKPHGIIRANLHSSLQRTYFFRVQNVFKMMGLMEGNPRELEIEIVKDVMNTLKNEVYVKAKTWIPNKAKEEQWILMNYLFQGDQGYTIPEMFSALRTAGLEFISMVNWRQWELMDLFQEPNNLPTFLAMSLPDIPVEDRLHLFELLHPIHRLLDFWCGHPNQTQNLVPIIDWTESEWHQALIHLHPQLKTHKVKEDLIESITNQNSFEISSYIPSPTKVAININSTMAACLLPLWDKAQPITSLVERWRKIRPLDPVTLKLINPQIAFEEIKRLLIELETFLYVLLEL